MARIYISSTYEDLKDYRSAVSSILRSLEHEDVAMEHYGAADVRPLDKCLEDVASSDVYLGIFAWRYGFIPDGQDKSITELEYRHAKALGKPCLIFLLHEEAPWSKKLIELPAQEKLEQLRAEMQKDKIVAFFSSSDDLKAKVAQAVSAWAKGVAEGSDHISWHYERQYRELLAKTYGKVTAPGYIGERRGIDLDRLYVLPTFSTPDLKQPLSATSFVSQISRAVVLGNPGSGKSTFAFKLCCDLANRYPEHIIGDLERTPILVTVRDYGVEKKRSNCSIVDFMAIQANSEYQIKPPEKFFENLLRTGRAIVVFDGLDELLDTKDRQTVRNDIEAFCEVYPSVPVLITSREVGYEEAPLDKNMFKVFYLANFENKQITEYAQKWFSLDEGAEQDRRELSSFLMELNTIPIELKSNPLLLALLCSLYQGEGYIPRSKAQIYERCSELLFGKRDEDRGIKVDIGFDAYKRPTVGNLAHWIFQDSALQAGVTEHKLVLHATEYLLQQHFEDRAIAENTARKFIQFCSGRAWVFTDTGTTKDGERLFQFTHRTFLEFFAAEYLTFTHRDSKSLLAELLPHLQSGEWIEIAQIAFQKMIRNHEGSGDELMAALLESTDQGNNEQSDHLLTFAVRALEFMIPKPSLTRRLIARCAERCVELGVKDLQEIMDDEEITVNEAYTQGYFPGNSSFIPNLIIAIAAAAVENREPIGAALEETLIKIIGSGEGYTALIAAEFGLGLSGVSWRQEDEPALIELRRFFWRVARRIFEARADHIEDRLCPKYVRVALDAYYLDRVSLNDLIRWHGPRIAFEQHHCLIYSHFYNGVMVVDTLSDLCRENTAEEDAAACVQELRELGDALLPVPTPWLPEFDEESFTWRATCSRDMSGLDNRALFGLFVAVAFNYEQVNHNSFEEPFAQLLPEYFGHILAARNMKYDWADDEVEESIKPDLDKCGFSEAQRYFVWDWVNGDRYLIGS